MSTLPWRRGKSLVWDFTCPDTLAASHVQETSSRPGAAAISAEHFKSNKYADLTPSYDVVPIAIETLGSWGPAAWEFMADLGRRISQVTGEPRSGAFLRQRLAITVQRGNAASIRGTQIHLQPPLGSRGGHHEGRTCLPPSPPKLRGGEFSGSLSLTI